MPGNLSDLNFTPRITNSFHAKTTQKILTKFPSLAKKTKECIKECSLPLLSEYLKTYNPDHNQLGPLQKHKIIT